MSETGVTLETTAEERDFRSGGMVIHGGSARFSNRLLRDVSTLLAALEAKDREIEKLKFDYAAAHEQFADDVIEFNAQIARLKSEAGTAAASGPDDAVARAILDDLCGRSGVGDVLEAIKYDDPETWHDIVASVNAPILASLTAAEKRGAEREREACAKIADSYVGREGDAAVLIWLPEQIAEVIRGRSQPDERVG